MTVPYVYQKPHHAAPNASPSITALSNAKDPNAQCHQLLCTKQMQKGARPSPHRRLGLEFPEPSAGPRSMGTVRCATQRG
jgi:hypothetical protein